MFSREELEVLKDVWEKFKNYTAGEMSTITHNEEGYIRTNMNQVIPYEYAKVLKAIN
jgi:uncharacterized phage-associated protein